MPWKIQRLIATNSINLITWLDFVRTFYSHDHVELQDTLNAKLMEIFDTVSKQLFLLVNIVHGDDISVDLSRRTHYSKVTSASHVCIGHRLQMAWVPIYYLFRSRLKHKYRWGSPTGSPFKQFHDCHSSQLLHLDMSVVHVKSQRPDVQTPCLPC